jgi:hypothetical protein
MRDLFKAAIICVSVLAGGMSLHPAVAAEPPPQVWYMPDADTPDLLEMFKNPNLWAKARPHINVFLLGVHQAMKDNPSHTNTVLDLARVGAFQLLRQSGISLALAAPGVKEWDCSGDRAATGTLSFLKNLRESGGEVIYLSLDEPLISGILRCHISIAEVAARTAKYIRRIKEKFPAIRIGDIEGYPTFTPSQLREFVLGVKAAGEPLDFFHVDPNIPVFKFRRELSPAADLRSLQAFFAEQGIPFGIIIWSGHNPEANDRNFYDRAMEWARWVHTNVGQPSNLIFASWAWRSSVGCVDESRRCSVRELHCSSSDPSYCGQKSVPLNLPDIDKNKYSMTRLVLDALRDFGYP